MKTYIIRTVNFEYGDDFYFPTGLSESINHIFDNEAEARKAYIALERKGYQDDYIMAYFQPPRETEGESTHDKLESFYAENFGLPFNGTPFIPKEATDEQVERILQLTGLRFYSLIVFDKPKTFFKSTRKSKNTSNYYDSYKQALESSLIGVINSTFAMSSIEGRLEDITDSPDLLLAYLTQCQYLKITKLQGDIYDISLPDEEGAWLMDWVGKEEKEQTLQEVNGFVALLREKPFEIVEVDFQEFKK
ncbi:MAG: hypothetical protein EAZ95_10060 [Bacteroidetes bacterium]|nr:MAG: hypothetical protein EAZ95_10060 [Bacteroidota bacterium]